MTAQDMLSKYEMTIGIESHVQLKTASKLFSPADNDARDRAPNSCVHPIDYGLPGMLPLLNKEAVNLAIKAGKAMNCNIANVSRFDRKHYFYPDLPNGYQITQMYHPTILGGTVEAPLESGGSVRVRINHAHLEADAGKLTHYGTYTLADYNRTGTPLIEIVTEPDIHSAEEAKAFCQELHRLMVYAGVSHGDLYHGNQRFDVNISVAPKGSTELGKRAEIKNLNSFRSIERAIAYEFKRQTELLEQGEKVVQETRGWHDAKQVTFSQRSKENAQDYRYMPDPDIPPVHLTDEYIAEVQATVPMLPPEYRAKFAGLQVDKSVINSLLSTKQYADTVMDVLSQAGNDAARRAANWYASVVTTDAEDVEADTSPSVPDATASVPQLIALNAMVEANEVSGSTAKELFTRIVTRGADYDVRQDASDSGLIQVSDEGEIAKVVDEVLADPASAASLADIKAGKDKAIGYLVGQVMKKSQGKANPALAQKLIRERL
jgi:aspartyl-tRNA(Asn)/glutamyl-tRNA(Gln) amidotransferase subunit B